MVAADNSPVPDYLDLLRVDRRNYVVLGAGQGMGRQTCHALTQAGAASIVCVDIESGACRGYRARDRHRDSVGRRRDKA